MFAPGTGSMRGPRGKTPLLLLLLLLTTLTRTVLCQDGDEGADAELEIVEDEEVVELGGEADIPELLPTVSDATSAAGPSTSVDDVENINEEDHGGSGRILAVDETTVDPSITGPTDLPEDKLVDEVLSPLIIMIPVVLVVIIIGMIVCGTFINRRWRKKAINHELRKEDPYLDGSSTEKVPMPMFEEDVPSVLELEMEELDNWMIKDGEPADNSKHP